MVVIGCASVIVSVYVLRLFHTGLDKPLPRRTKLVRFLRYIGAIRGLVTWQTLARMLDKVMFVVFMVATLAVICTTIVAFVFLPRKPESGDAFPCL